MSSLTGDSISIFISESSSSASSNRARVVDIGGVCVDKPSITRGGAEEVRRISELVRKGVEVEVTPHRGVGCAVEPDAPDAKGLEFVLENGLEAAWAGRPC